MTSNKQDAELLEYLQTHKSSHVKQAVQKIHASFEEAASSRFPASPRTPIRRNTKASKSTTNSPVKRRINELERKIIEQSETTTTTTTRNNYLLSLTPRSRRRITGHVFNSPKRLWGNNDDDTTISTVSISSLSMSSSSTVDRPILDISFERPSLLEKPSINIFGSCSSDAIRKIDHISVLDSSFNGSVSSGAQMLPFSQDCPSETTLSNEVEESPDKCVLHYNYFVLSILLLCAKGVDPVAICTIYLWLEMLAVCFGYQVQEQSI